MTALESILAVFMAIGEWIVNAVESFVPMFYVAETGLTFLGVLAVSGLGIAIVMMLINIIRGFLRFK